MKAFRVGLKIVFANAVLLILPLTIVCAQETGPGSATPKNLADATDEQLVEVLSSTSAEKAIEILQERINQYSADVRIDEIERLIPSFLTAEGDNYVWEVKDSILERARRHAEEGRHEDAELELRGLPHFLRGAAGNSVSEAAFILSKRARQYAKEGRKQNMERLMRLLVPVLEDTSLDESRRWHALDVMSIPARFDMTADAAFDVVCRLIVDDPSAKVRHRAVRMLQEPRRADAIPFFKAAALDERNVARGGPEGSVRQAAIETLGWCGGPDAAAVLLELRSNESLSREDQDVTIKALARTGSAYVALPELLKIIETGDLNEMCTAIVGLGSGFNRYPRDACSTIMHVFQAGLHHPNDGVRKATCTAMQDTGDFYLIPLIEPLLDDPSVRPYAESAIRGLQRPMTEYRQMIGIPDEERDMSIEEVVKKGWAYSSIMLRWRLADDPTKQQIFDKLAKSAVKSPDETARRHVLRIFEELPERRDDAVPVVLKVLATTEDPFTRDECYGVLGKLGGPEAIRILKDAILRGPAEPGGTAWRHAGELYSNLYWYLGSCGPDAAPVLFEIAKKLDRGDDYRLWAALAATHNEELVMPFLLEKSRTAVGWNRSRALHSACLLARTSCPPDTRRQIAEMLVQDADSEHSSVREVVAWGLGVVGDETHIALLERMAAEDPYSSRQVGSRGDEKIDRILYPIREAAAKSIENIRNRVAQEQEAAAE